jgi:ABC-2 type transport system ATP-binding protein
MRRLRTAATDGATMPISTARPRRRAGMSAVAAVVALVLLVSACSSSKSKSTGATASAPETTAAASAPSPQRTCNRPVAAPVPAVRVAGSTSDWTLTSFDGTQLRIHWFPTSGATANHPKPTVLMGPGWGESGALAGQTDSLFGGFDVDTLLKAGYNVLTWDPRGFGKSNGTIEVDSSQYEARDVSRMLDWVATQPGVQLDRKGDPRVGMLGASYGGGIQLSTAPIDCRIDAIVPQIAWNSLGTSLYKAGTVKIGWAGLLQSIAPPAHSDPHQTSAWQESQSTGVLSPDDVAWFRNRGPGAAVSKITAPTLLLQGTVDTLFTLDEGVTNYSLLRKAGTPVAMLWFCGGHGFCPTNPGDMQAPLNAALAWLDRYVKDDHNAPKVPTFQTVDQNGTDYTSDRYPLPQGAPFNGSGSGTLQLVATGGAGPFTAPVSPTQELAGIAKGITPAKATNAVNVGVPIDRTAMVLGAPQLQLSYSGTVGSGDRPERVFAQVIDDKTGLVLGNQITPIDVTLDGKPHTTSVPLEIVVQSVHPGDSLTVQIVATTVAYATPRLDGSVTFNHIEVQLPTVTDLSTSAAP